LRVVDSRGAEGGAANGGVIVVLDASGSMLQRLDGERRIDIAKASLKQLISEDLPDNTLFGLRVFGHKEADSCRTDLEIPLGPLDRRAANARVASVSAMNLAKTPIADTLAKAGGDLAGKSGSNLIILLTDGEETCEGDPAAVITSLRNSGLDVRVNIVGFAIDELMLRESFESWAALGGGQYIDARNAAELSAGLSSAIERPFEVLDADGTQVGSGLVNGLALELPPGDYQVQFAGSDARSVTLQADEETIVSLD
jgi:Mg-chelatase subunit ChlD